MTTWKLILTGQTKSYKTFVSGSLVITVIIWFTALHLSMKIPQILTLWKQNMYLPKWENYHPS